jgi:hypothetical protein
MSRVYQSSSEPSAVPVEGYDVAQDGFKIVEGVLEADEVQEMIARLGLLARAGRRGLLAVPAVRRVAQSPQIIGLMRQYFAGDPFPVRAIYFNKYPHRNWSVPWHQDLSLALRARVEVEGFGPWSTKEGVVHVQPPVGFLEQMLTVRLHLDAADERNGALRVLPGTHTLGRLSRASIEKLRATRPEHVCRADPGDALLMRPLLLHASGRSASDRDRRVLHIEYAAFALPAGLEWAEAS